MKKLGISIRSARLVDWPHVLKLAQAMHAESRFSGFELKEQKLRTVFEDQLNNPKIACCLLAEASNGQIIGMLVGFIVELYFSDKWVAQDRVFFVMPAFRGSSAAVRLLTVFRKWAECRHVQELNINMSVAVDMKRFERFMVHMGFTNCGSNFYYRL
jgi:GNAT superfamily N-acetyltransferase